MWPFNLLHDQIINLIAHDRVKMMIHALVELGVVTKLECTYEHCKMPTREFGTGRLKPCIDHIVSRSRGGSNLPSNLQVLHWGCNSRKAHFEDSNIPIDEFMQRIRDRGAQVHNHSAFMKSYWSDPKIREERLRKRRETPTPRATCECGLNSTVAAMSRHTKYSGHTATRDDE